MAHFFYCVHLREERRAKGFLPRSTEFRWSVFVGQKTKVHRIDEGYAWPGMKISDISIDISPIYPISAMFDTISAMIDISPIYRFWTDISWKYHVCGTCVC